jgi:hypothetical protein
LHKDKHKVRGKDEMHFKKKLESRAIPQNPGENSQGMSPSMKSKQNKSSGESPIVKKKLKAKENIKLKTSFKQVKGSQTKFKSLF